jgi:hypothetical protein
MLPESLASSRALAAFGLVCAILAVYAFLWGAVKLAWQRVTGTPMPRTRLTIGLDIGADVAVNILGAVSRTLKLTGGSALFWPTLPTAPTRPEVPPPNDPQRGHIRRALLGLVLLISLAGFALRCIHAPVLPPVVGCTPGASVCDHDAKMVCSSTGRWEPAGDESCAAQGRVCAMTDGGARCVRLTDGGTDADQ